MQAFLRKKIRWCYRERSQASRANARDKHHEQMLAMLAMFASNCYSYQPLHVSRPPTFPGVSDHDRAFDAILGDIKKWFCKTKDFVIFGHFGDIGSMSRLAVSRPGPSVCAVEIMQRGPPGDRWWGGCSSYLVIGGLQARRNVHGK